MAAILNFYFRFWFWPFRCHRHDSALAYQLLCKLDERRRSYDVILILQYGGHMAMTTEFRPESTSGFQFGHIWHLGRSKAIGVQNFDQISQSVADILLHLALKNKRPPYWNSTSGFDFDFITVIGMWFCTALPNFMQIGWSPTELWRHIDFTRWRP